MAWKYRDLHTQQPRKVAYKPVLLIAAVLLKAIRSWIPHIQDSLIAAAWAVLRVGMVFFVPLVSFLVSHPTTTWHTSSTTGGTTVMYLHVVSCL